MTARSWCATSGVALALLWPGSAGAEIPLSLGYFDDVYSEAAPLRGPWLARTVSSGADIVRIDIGWKELSTQKPPADASDPADPVYDFTRADEAILDATSRGLRVIASFTRAPVWAEGRGRPSTASPGSWKPDPAAVGRYGSAIARRYSGTYADPARPGRKLPRVDAFQLWNEPNLSEYLSPQWTRSHTYAATHYRRMLNAFYRGVKATGSTARVVTGGTAPFGDASDSQAGDAYARPASCANACLGGSTKAFAPNPVPTPPLRRARTPPILDLKPRRAADDVDDISIPDLGRLTRLLRTAERTGRVLPPVHHRLWVTEVSYDSAPPDRNGVPVEQHARWLQETLYLLWRQGVDTILWFQVRDAPTDDTQALNQSGTYFRTGAAKPAAHALYFPSSPRRESRESCESGGARPRVDASASRRSRQRAGIPSTPPAQAGTASSSSASMPAVRHASAPATATTPASSGRRTLDRPLARLGARDAADRRHHPTPAQYGRRHGPSGHYPEHGPRAGTTSRLGRVLQRPRPRWASDPRRRPAAARVASAPMRSTA